MRGASFQRWFSWLGGLALMSTGIPIATSVPAEARSAAPPRWSAGGFVEGYRVVEADEATARQRPAARLDLFLRADLLPRTRIFIDTRTLVGGTPRHADGFDVFNISDTFQNHSPSFEVEEAYLDVQLGQADFRLGKQKFAWGRLDLFRPTDVINPRRYSDPFLADDEDAKIGIPAAQLSYYFDLGTDLGADLGPLRFNLVWAPVPVPFRFPLQEERWFPASASVPGAVVIPADFFGLGSGATITPVLRTQNARPPQQFDEGAVALRLAGAWGSTEWTLSYYDGAETLPAFSFATGVYSPSAQAKVARGERPTIPGGDLQQLVADATLRPRYSRMRLIGFDLARPLGGFTTRFEAAYGIGRMVPRSTDSLLALDNIGGSVGDDLFGTVDTILRGGIAEIDLGELSVRRDRFEWGAGVDYAIAGWVPLLQIHQAILTDRGDTSSLLVARTDTRLLLALRKALFDDALALDLVGFQGMERSYTTGLARFTWSITDRLRARFGYLLIAGTRRSVIGQFHDQDQAFLQLRYTF